MLLPLILVSHPLRRNSEALGRVVQRVLCHGKAHVTKEGGLRQNLEPFSGPTGFITRAPVWMEARSFSFVFLSQQKCAESPGGGLLLRLTECIL